MKRGISFVILLSLSFFLYSCNTTEPPPPPNGDKPTLELTLEDVSCIEAWIELTTTNLQLPATITLKQINPTGDSLSQYFILNTQYSLLYIDSLLPNKNYQYQVTSIPQSGGQNPATSNELYVTTMDTTSHDFTWQQFTFGEHNPSTLFDVAIVGEEIWAVGAIYMKDSLGNDDPIPYNAIHWDGTDWKLMRIMFYTICGQQSRTPYPAKSVFAFNANEVWIAMDGDQIAKIENGVQTQTRCLPWSFTINKIWGSSSNDLYAVGDNGNIAHYNGTLWTSLESGTDVDLLDVWGSPDVSVVWACGYYRAKPGTYLLRSTGDDFEMAYDGTANEFKILQDTISGAMTSVYTPYEKRIFVCTTSGVYNSPSNTNGRGKRLSFTPGQFPGLPYRLRGNGINDFTIAGDHLFIAHYNGYSWRNFEELLTSDIRLLSVTQKGDLVVAVGYQYLLPYYNPVVILVGRR